MADTKITDLAAMTVLSANDILTVVDVGGTPVNKKMTIAWFLANLTSNTNIGGNLTVTGNTTFNQETHYNANSQFNERVEMRHAVEVANTAFRVSGSQTPANSSVTFGGHGSLAWDETYLYMETANNTIKRIAWTTF